jgi:hypothetical protein
MTKNSAVPYAVNKIFELDTLWESQISHIHAVIILFNFTNKLTTNSRDCGLPVCLVTVMVIDVVFYILQFLVQVLYYFCDLIMVVAVCWAVLLSKKHVKNQQSWRWA